jgi:hypothetical protein
MISLLFDEAEWEAGIGVLANADELASGVIKNDLPAWGCEAEVRLVAAPQCRRASPRAVLSRRWPWALPPPQGVWVLAELFQAEMAEDADAPWAPPYTDAPPAPPLPPRRRPEAPLDRIARPPDGNDGNDRIIA